MPKLSISVISDISGINDEKENEVRYGNLTCDSTEKYNQPAESFFDWAIQYP
jgi:hypothetical protein